MQQDFFQWEFAHIKKIKNHVVKINLDNIRVRFRNFALEQGN